MPGITRGVQKYDAHGQSGKHIAVVGPQRVNAT
jgi:hypothetical protein